MPFDGSGNFSRLYSWQSDRDNGIKILAVRMDGEFDNFAAGMNQVFFRNGLVPMTANLNMGQNYLYGLGAGSAAALAVRFADDGNSGLFLNGIGKPTLAAGGVGRIEANTTGAAVTGNLAVSGDASVVGTFTTTNGLSIDAQYFLKLSASKPTINLDTDDYINYDRAANVLGVTIGTQRLLAVAGNGIVVAHPTTSRMQQNTGSATVFHDLVDAGAASYRRVSNQVSTALAYDDSDTHTFRTNLGTDKVGFEANGNVRIGSGLSGSAASALDIQRTGTNTAQIYARNAAHALTLGSDVNGSFLGTATNSGFSIFTNNATRMAFAANGNIGIGINPPARLLDVNGSSRFMQDQPPTTGAVTIRQSPGDVYGGFIQWVNNGNSAEKAWLGVDTSGNMTFAPNSGAALTLTNDQRILDKFGLELGWKDLPINNQGGAYVVQIADRGKCIYFSSGGGQLSIYANSVVPCPVGFSCVVVNDSGTPRNIGLDPGVTLRWMGSGAVGGRTLADGGMCTLVQVQPNRWIISGAGLS